jgi:hypothetical protein
MVQDGRASGQVGLGLEAGALVIALARWAVSESSAKIENAIAQQESRSVLKLKRDVARRMHFPIGREGV